jgi:hypothetical protein
MIERIPEQKRILQEQLTNKVIRVRMLSIRTVEAPGCLGTNRERTEVDDLLKQGDVMVDLQAAQIELQNARRARINAQHACSDIEDLTDEIRRARYAFMRRTSVRRSGVGMR